MESKQGQEGLRIHPVSFVAGGMFTTALLAVAIWAMAETTVGYGMNCGTMYGDGAWVQNDLPYHSRECGDVLSLTYVGDTSTPWLKYTVGAAYRRGPEASGEFVDDECHAYKQYSGGPVLVSGGIAMGQCDRRFVAEKVQTTVYAVPFTLRPTWQITKTDSIFIGVGGSIYYAVQAVKWSADPSVPNNICAIGACDGGRYQRFGFSPYFEIGGSYERVGLTFYYAYAERPTEAMQHGMYGVMATVRL